MKFIKQFSLYTFIGFFNAGINFLLMPYLSHHIDPAGYGILSMVNSFVTILIPLAGLTASGLIAVEYYKVKDQREYASIFSSVQVIPILPGALLLLLSLVFRSPIASFLEIPQPKAYWIPLSVLIALFSIYYETQLNFNAVEQKAAAYARFSIIRLLIEVGLTLFFISVVHLSWEGRLFSWLVSSMISFFISFFYFRKRGLLTWNIQKKHIRAAVVFGLPLILHTIGKFVINQSDRIFIARMVSIEEAGIYNIGYQVGMIILLLVSSVGNFYQPYLFERLADLTEKAKLEIVRTTYIILFGLLVSVILLALCAPLLFRYFIAPGYGKGIIYVFWTGLSYFFWGIYILFAGFIFYRRKTKQLGYLAVLNVVLNILLNYFLIRQFGALGAVYATCISFFVVAIIVVYTSSFLIELPWFSYKRIAGRQDGTP